MEAALPYLIIVGVGAAFALPVTLLVLFAAFVPTGVLFVTTGIATAVVWWAHCQAREDHPYARTARRVGYGSLAGAIIVGAVRLAHDLADIL